MQAAGTPAVHCGAIVSQGCSFFFLLLHPLSRQRWGVGKRGPPLDHVTPKGASEGYWFSGVMQGKVLTLGLQTMLGVCCATP